MDASYKIQRGIHVHLIQFFMCPEFWVHIRAFAAYPRFLKLWLRYSTVTLTTIQPHFCPLIAEQPATPYPGGITRAKIGKTKVRTRK
mgnify:CR=1 FL=1